MSVREGRRSPADPAFGAGRPFTVGVEEELFLVDPATHALVDDAGRVLAAIDAPDRAADHEAYACEIELRSPPCGGAGATLAGAGLHPTARPGDFELVDSPRYRDVEDAMRGLMRRSPECALHVHVGVPDAATAIGVFNRLREHLPLLAGLAANSPWWFGRDSGFASARAAQVRAYPGRGVPPPFAGYDEYLAALEAAAAGGGPDDYTLLWWDVRPHPRLGTVEVRELDAQSRIDDAAALAALVQGLARAAAEPPVQRPPLPSAAISWSAFRAVRDGLEATILHDGELLPLPEAARRAVAVIRPFARDHGSEEALAGIERILAAGNGADRRRAAARRGGPSEILSDIVRESGE